MTTANDEIELTTDPRMWQKAGWIARIIRSEDGDGWAASMTRPGDSDPALVTPWVMGRDKVNPKPLDHSGFATLLKGVTEVLQRHHDANRARMHRSITCLDANGHRVRADFDIQLDEDDPHALVTIIDELSGDTVRTGRASTGWKLSEANVQKFIRTGEA